MSEDDALNFLLIDAYVRCAPTERNSIGNAEPDDTTDNSTKFTATIAAEGLTVANTDSPAGATWTSTKRPQARIDHTSVPHSLMPHAVSGDGGMNNTHSSSLHDHDAVR